MDTTFEGLTDAAAGSSVLRARVVGALWWERDRGRGSDWRVGWSAGSGSPVGALLADLGQADARRGGREFHRRDAGAIPRRRRAGRAERGRDRLPRPGSPAGLRDPLDAAGFQVHFHAIGDRAVRSALDAVEAARRSQRVERPATPHRPHPGDPPRRSPSLPPPGGGGERPATLGPARGVPARPHHPVPGRAALAVAVPVSSACSAAAPPWRSGATGRCPPPNPWKILEVAVRRVDPDHRHRAVSPR